MQSLPKSVLPILYLKANTYPWRLLCRRPSPNWPSSVVIANDSGKLMPRIGPRMISWEKKLNHRRNVLPLCETGNPVLSYRGFEWPSSFFLPLRCDGRDMDFASLTKAHHALSITIENAQKEAEQAKSLAKNALAGTYMLLLIFWSCPQRPISYGTLDWVWRYVKASSWYQGCPKRITGWSSCMYGIFYLVFFLTFMNSFKPNGLQIYSAINFITNQLY